MDEELPLPPVPPITALRRAGAIRGLIEPGNIDVSNRPRVTMEDGSTATVRSLSFNEEGREVLVPTVSDEGRIMSDDEAIAHYRQGGRHLGIFATPQAATAFARSLSADQGAMLNNRGGALNMLRERSGTRNQGQ